MPIYEYQCKHCQHQLDVLQKITDPPKVTCPECGQDTLKKCVSAAGFRLKGSGWYETDFKGGKDKQKNSSPKEEKVSETKVENKTKTEETKSD